MYMEHFYIHWHAFSQDVSIPPQEKELTTVVYVLPLWKQPLASITSYYLYWVIHKHWSSHSPEQSAPYLRESHITVPQSTRGLLYEILPCGDSSEYIKTDRQIFFCGDSVQSLQCFEAKWHLQHLTDGECETSDCGGGFLLLFWEELWAVLSVQLECVFWWGRFLKG